MNHKFSLLIIFVTIHIITQVNANECLGEILHSFTPRCVNARSCAEYAVTDMTIFDVVGVKNNTSDLKMFAKRYMEYLYSLIKLENFELPETFCEAYKDNLNKKRKVGSSTTEVKDEYQLCIEILQKVGLISSSRKKTFHMLYYNIKRQDNSIVVYKNVDISDMKMEVYYDNETIRFVHEYQEFIFTKINYSKLQSGDSPTTWCNRTLTLKY